MQQNPVHRTLRIVGLSIGFMLFVLLAVHSASQVSDPRFIKGKPFLFAFSGQGARTTLLDTGNAEAAVAIPAPTGKPVSEQGHPSGATIAQHSGEKRQGTVMVATHEPPTVTVETAGSGQAQKVLTHPTSAIRQH